MSINFDHLLLSNQDLLLIKNKFVQELQKASHGEKNSIPFLHNPLPGHPTVDEGNNFQVMVIGGSLFKNALMKINDNKPIILKYDKFRLPPLTHVSKLFSLIQDNLDPSVSHIALNFTYPMTPFVRNGFLDGILIKGTKEHVFEGLVGNPVGESIEKYLLTQKHNVKVVVANDTVCLALAGLDTLAWNNIVAGVVGTGVNFGFFHDKNTVVNLESGNFNGFERSNMGKRIDSLFPETNGQFFEKEVSGAYLFHHFNFLSEQNKLPARVNSTEELNKLAKTGSPDGILASMLLKRSASLVAVQIAGIARFLTNCNQLQLVSTSFNYFMEGSLFWDGHHYLDNIKAYLKLLEIPENAIAFSHIQKSSVKGAARLFQTI